MNAPLVVLLAAFLPMLFEASRSRRHARALRLAGAVEPAGDVYGAMQIAYPACFAVIVAEGYLRSGSFDRWFAAGAVVFTAAKVLKYWAIAALGPRWTFRVLVPPHASRVTRGPYRWFRHPNYAGVAGELAGAALMARAPITGVLSIVVFGGLMLARIKVEERAMDICVR